MYHAGTRGKGTARPRPGPTRSVTIGTLITAIESFDLAVVAVSSLVAHWLRFDSFQMANSRVILVIMALVIGFLVFRRVGLYDLPVIKQTLSQIRRAITATVTIFLFVVVIGYATKAGFSVSRLWLGYWFLLATGTLVLTRPVITFIYYRLEAAGYFARHFAVFATMDELANLERFVKRWSRIMPRSDRILGIFLDRPEEVADRDGGRDLPVIGSIDDFLTWESNTVIDGAVAVMRSEDRSLLEPVLRKLRTVSVDLDLVAGHVDEEWASRPVGKLAGLPVIRVMTQPLSLPQLGLKRAEDIVIAGLALVILSPVMLLVALAIKLDSPGPVLFRQARHGFNNQKFQVYKFRSMRHAPDVAATVAQAQKNDPRITRVGAFLRRTSIDELPQLFNVLNGEMSIVGPRPHAVQHNDHYARRIDSYLARHRIKPGITGWAQVHGLRGETDTDEKMSKRVEHDLYYADHWSLTLDIKIILLTVRCLVHPNAY